MADFPFQWDDGNFISPFVAASADDMKAFAAWLTQRYLTALRGASRRPLEMRVTDLGCGDAAAVLALAQYLHRGWTELQATAGADAVPNTPLRLLVTGVELDETLLVQAEENASVFAHTVAAATSSPLAVETHFVNADIRSADLDVYFPRRLPHPSSSVAASLPYVLYMYLLPDALEMLREKLEEVLQRGWVVASNRWPIPGMEAALKDCVGHVHVYYQ